MASSSFHDKMGYAFEKAPLDARSKGACLHYFSAIIQHLGQHCTIRQEQAARDFSPDEGSESEGILCVFPAF
jgi:hypothetical protein